MNISKPPFYLKIALILVGAYLFFEILYIAKDIIAPIIYSIIIAIVLSPIVRYLTNKKINKIIAISIILTCVIAVSFLLVFFLWIQFAQFADSFPILIKKLNLLLDNSSNWVTENFNVSNQKIKLWISIKNEELIINANAAIGQTIINTGSLLLVLILIPVYVFMILYYQPLLIEFIHKLFEVNDQKRVNEVLAGTKRIVRSYLVGLSIEAIIVAFLNTIALFIIGIDYAILLGVFGAILNLIPYIGGIIGVALPMIIALITKPTYSESLIVLATYILIQFIDNNYIVPKIVASKVKINALASVVVVIVGGALWGVSGMFLSIPLLAIGKIIFDQIDSLKPYGYLLGEEMPISNKILK
ncbi:MAG: AI-2E family transporter [Bacteroidia bacterium]|nr:AI-2E family transporter [Bacteroidia bacterium]